MPSPGPWPYGTMETSDETSETPIARPREFATIHGRLLTTVETAMDCAAPTKAPAARPNAPEASQPGMESRREEAIALMLVAPRAIYAASHPSADKNTQSRRGTFVPGSIRH